MEAMSFTERLRELNAAGTPSRCDIVYGVIHDREGCAGSGTSCDKCTVWKDLADIIDTQYTPNDVADDDFFKLPKDKNGKPIHVGDTVNVERLFGLSHQEKVAFIGEIDGDGRVSYYDKMKNKWTWSLSFDCEIVEPSKPKETIDDIREGIDRAVHAMGNEEVFTRLSRYCKDENLSLYDASQPMSGGIGHCISAICGDAIDRAYECGKRDTKSL